MSKAFLLSLIISAIVIPAITAKEKNPRKGLKKTIVWVLVFNAFYLFNLMYLYGRL
ncbi:MAG TPA: hypothetical protein VHU80_15680 [Polyangiaceae bacterium]|nr:hypothetical protein [Polyangiaceae bacterium]